MIAETIAVGTELLIGQIANTNAQYLSQKLNSIGIGVYYHTVVGDNLKRIVEQIELAFSRSDYIFITGGLGPTEDDITREAVAHFLGFPLIQNVEVLDKIVSFFKDRNIDMPPSNLKQALFPENSIILRNECGTAPGFFVEKDEKFIVVLPGPPKEMTHIFENEVMDKLFSNEKSSILSKYINIFGIGESQIEEKIIDLIETQSSPTIATYVKNGIVTIRLTVSDNNSFEPVLSEILSRFGDSIISTENKTLPEVTSELLTKKSLTLATAESCTGGLIGKMLTDMSGISSVYMGGVISYSNFAKESILEVKNDTLNKYGAVSSETAIEMAVGARTKLNADIGISVTGIAGPTGGSEEKPVGLVYIGFSSKEKTFSKELRLTGDRERIRNITSLHALDILRRYLLEE